MFKKSIIILAVLFALPSILYAYDNDLAHPKINGLAVEQSQLANVMVSLGFTNGLNTKFEGKTVKEWFQEGGIKEDEPSIRALNHFFDPLKPWGEAGLTLIPLTSSSLIWAQASNQTIDNSYSWPQARLYYASALTTWGQKFNKDEIFPILFRTLGQLMHLVSDKTVPAHVRNDIHPIFQNDIPLLLPFLPSALFNDPYEWYVEDNIKDLNYLGVPVNLSIFNNFDNQASTIASIPISALWDQNKYEGITPDPSVTKNIDPVFHNIGIAEYTNANFYSINTAYNKLYYPHPSLDEDLSAPEWLTPEVHVAEDQQTDYRPYFWGNVGGTQSIRIAAASLLTYNCLLKSGKTPTVVLDDRVHEDYASVLIPRAIGYSAVLIDYFFRGNLEVKVLSVETSPGQSVPPALVDGALTWLTAISRLTVTAQNISELGTDENGNVIPELIGNGTIQAVAHYTVGTEQTYTVSLPVELSQSQIDTINSTVPLEIAFDLIDSIPAGAINLSTQIVFQGTLGSEQDIAVAVGRTEIPGGTLEITAPDEYVYAILDASTGTTIQDEKWPHNFSHLKAKIRNTTTAEDENGNSVPVDFTEGVLYAVAYYRQIPGLLPELSNYFQDAAESESTMWLVPFSSSTSSPITIGAGADSIPSDMPATLTFDFSNEPIPTKITDLQLAVYYQGKLGTENTSSFVIGVKDLNEPQYLTFWNNTDYFLLDGAPVKADDIRDNPDVSQYGYINPQKISEEVGFSALSSSVNPAPLFSFNLLEAGRYAKVALLTDDPDGYLMTERLVTYWLDDSTVVIDSTGKDSMSAFVNQGSMYGTWDFTPIIHDRGIYQHQRTYFINCYPNCVYMPSFPVSPENPQGPTPVSINFP